MAESIVALSGIATKQVKNAFAKATQLQKVAQKAAIKPVPNTTKPITSSIPLKDFDFSPAATTAAALAPAAVQAQAPTTTETETDTDEAGGPCDCPGQRDSAGKRCGGRCALVKKGGREPSCGNSGLLENAANNILGVSSGDVSIGAAAFNQFEVTVSEFAGTSLDDLLSGAEDPLQFGLDTAQGALESAIAVPIDTIAASLEKAKAAEQKAKDAGLPGASIAGIESIAQDIVDSAFVEKGSSVFGTPQKLVPASVSNAFKASKAKSAAGFVAN